MIQTLSNDAGLCSAVLNYTVSGTVDCDTTATQTPNQTSTFGGNARGYFFVAPIDFNITALRVPNTASSADQNVQVMRLSTLPPNFSATTTYDALLHWSGLTPGNNFIPVNIPIAAGDIIGILGTRGTNSTNSYTSDSIMVVAGMSITIKRLITQNDIHASPAPQNSFSTEPYGISPNIGRIDFNYQLAPMITQTAGLASGSAFPVGTTQLIHL